MAKTTKAFFIGVVFTLGLCFLATTMWKMHSRIAELEDHVLILHSHHKAMESTIILQTELLIHLSAEGSIMGGYNWL